MNEFKNMSLSIVCLAGIGLCIIIMLAIEHRLQTIRNNELINILNIILTELTKLEK